MNRWVKNTMKFPNRPVRTVLALAVCQLLLACAQPNRNNFVSHFSEASSAQDFSFAADEADGSVKTGKKKSESDESQPRVIEGTGKLLGKAQDAPAVKGDSIKLSFEEAPLAQVVRTILGDLLSVDYVLHPPISGTVTMSTQNAVSADQALNLLETALQANGMAMVRDVRGTYHVGRIDALKSIGASVRQASVGTQMAPGYGTILVPLQYIGANEMAAILRPMVPSDAIVRVDNVRNLLVMAGSRAQAEGWLDMVRTIDINLLEGMSVGVFPLKYVSVQEVSAALQLVGGGGAAAGAQGAVAPAGAAAVRSGTVPGTAAAGAASAVAGLGEGNPLFGALRIMPIERLNSILVITPRAAYLEEARRWIAKLDQPGSGGSQAQLNIYRVQNGNARHLAGVLSGIFGGSTGGTSTNSGVAPGLGTSTNTGFGNSSFGNSSFGNSSFGNSSFGNSSFGNSGFGNSGFGNSGFGNSGFNSGTGLRTGSTGFGQSGVGSQTGINQGTGSTVANLGTVRVMADELNNSVLVWSTPAEYERIEAALKRLDLPPTQILIEASIVEVTLNDGLQYGLQWAFSGDVGNNGYSGSGLISTDGKRTTADIAAAIGQGFNYTLKNSAGTIKAALNALSSKTNVKVVASPSLMVLDNHTAAISVGTQQPYRSGEISTTTVGSSNAVSYQYKDTGVNLQVTPSVNAGNIVTMTVNQMVTDVGAKDEITQQVTFLQRQLSSRVSVRSGESIVMGGLIQENTSDGRSGIPVLHELPVVGNLFGSTNNSMRRTELLVIITPRVVRTDVDIREVSEDLREHMRSLSPLLRTPAQQNSSNVPSQPERPQ